MCSERDGMSGFGYKETLARLSLGVCFPLVSRHERPLFSNIGGLGPLTTPNRMSEASSLDASPAFNFSGGVLFDRENRTFRQELNTVGDAAAQSRFDVAETAGTNDNHVYFVLLGARDNCACDGAFLHYRHDIVSTLLARFFLRICN